MNNQNDPEGQTMTKAEIVDAVFERVGLPKKDTASVVEQVLDCVRETVARGETVKISQFGNFTVRRKGSRVGRNPKTGVEIEIPPRKVLVFRPSQILRARLNDEE